ncbi:MAG: hypothetical protein ABI949_15615, partial [Ilumatobacteraceae bacterium]
MALLVQCCDVDGCGYIPKVSASGCQLGSRRLAIIVIAKPARTVAEAINRLGTGEDEPVAGRIALAGTPGPAEAEAIVVVVGGTGGRASTRTVVVVAPSTTVVVGATVVGATVVVVGTTVVVVGTTVVVVVVVVGTGV